MLTKIIEKIKEYETIIIHRHIRPDGDCIGSQMGLKAILQESFPEKHIYAVGDDIPGYLSFLGEDDKIADEIYEDALVIVVDTSVKDRIYDQRFKLGKYVIKIDHHDDSESYGDIEHVEPKMAACSAIIVKMCVESNGLLKLNKSACVALYVGITTDTGRFMYRGINGELLSLAGVLIDQGIDIETIYSNLYIKKMEAFSFQGYVYNHVKFSENGVAYIYYSAKTMEKYNITCDDAAATVSLLSSIYDSLIWVTFVEYPENTRVRIRSRNVPINDIGALFRGGGHLNAAGATIFKRNEVKNVIEKLDERLKEFKAANPEVH